MANPNLRWIKILKPQLNCILCYYDPHLIYNKKASKRFHQAILDGGWLQQKRQMHDNLQCHCCDVAWEKMCEMSQKFKYQLDSGSGCPMESRTHFPSYFVSRYITAMTLQICHALPAEVRDCNWVTCGDCWDRLWVHENYNSANGAKIPELQNVNSNVIRSLRVVVCSVQTKKRGTGKIFFHL